MSWFPVPGPGRSNLVGNTGTREMLVLPRSLSFGPVRVGCSSRIREVTVHNWGSMPLTIRRIGLEGCGSRFFLVEPPVLPVEVTSGLPLGIRVRFEPVELGSGSCTLTIESDAPDTPRFDVPLSGEGTDTDFRIDQHRQLSGQKVDILFAIDNTGSMAEEQENLARNFEALAKEAVKWSSGFQVGVIDVGAFESNGGRLHGEPRILRYGSPPDQVAFEQDFRRLVNVGADAGTTIEAGLEAARLALSSPLIDGHNLGFLRADASLEIVFVSDEDDRSPGDVGFYVDLLKRLKGAQNTGLLHVSAVVGPPGGCSSAFGSAAEGTRYIAVAQATGGRVASLCDPAFATTLADVGANAFGLRTQFDLSGVPYVDSLHVFVDGVRVQGWRYDEEFNAVLFASPPQPNAQVRLEYTTTCRGG